MADNTQLNTGTDGDIVATDELTYSGDTAKIPLGRLVHVSGAEGSKTLHEFVFAEDAAHTTGDYGFQLLAVRTDTPANKSGADGDYEPLQVSGGRLWVSSTVTSVVPGTAATSLGKAIDSAAGATDTGVAILATRDDALGGLTPAEGDYANLLVDANGALWVNSNALTPGTAAANLGKAVDSAAGATDTGVAMLAVRDDALSTLTPAAGDYSSLFVDDEGALWSRTHKVGSIVDSTNSSTTPLGGGASFTGTAVDLLGYSALCITVHADVDSAASGMKFQFSTDGTNWDDSYDFTFTASEGTARRFQFPVTARYFRVNYTNGGGAQSTFRVQTILHTANQITSIHRLGDTATNDRSATLTKSAVIGYDGTDWTAIRVNTSGIPGSVVNFTGIDNVGNTLLGAAQDENGASTIAAIAGYMFDGTAWDRVRGDATNGMLVNLGTNNDIQGDTAHDSADANNPVKIGAKAADVLSDKTLVADDDRTDVFADLDGALLTRSGRPLGDFLSERTTNTDGASTAFTGDFAASGASIKNYVTAYSLHNSSGTAISVDFRDGAAGAVLWTVPVPANGGANLSGGGEPLFGTSANTALAFDASAATTTLTISVSGFKSKA